MRFLVSLLVFFCFVVHDCCAQQNSELSKDTSLWYNRTQHLEGVTVKSKRSRYSRKNNPAVELMRKVIEATKNDNDMLLSECEKLNESKGQNVNNSCNSFNSLFSSSTNCVSLQKYQKIMFGVNDVKLEDLESGLLSKIPNALNHIEACPYNNKLILPLTLSEIVSKKYHRSHPEEDPTKL